MNEVDKRRFRTIETDPEELEEKIRIHRRKVASVIIAIIVIAALALTGIYIFTKFRTYKSYQVLNEVEREDTVGTNYVAFQDNVLKYSTDGAVYCTSMNKLIWNQAYEMNDPIVDTCEDYVVIADRGGTKIYIGNTEMPQGEVEVAEPIRQIEVGNQGTVAVLMSNDSVSEVSLYSVDGKLLAHGVFHLEISGYPMSMSLSNEGTLLGISFLQLKNGVQNTVIQFFDFGKGGEEKIDHVVQEYSYDNAVFPEIEFLSQNTMVAYGDHATRLYHTGDSFSVIRELTYTGELQGVFHNEQCWGIAGTNIEATDSTATDATATDSTATDATATDSTATDSTNEMDIEFMVYGLDGKLIYQDKRSGEFTQIQLLENQGLAIINGNNCDLYSKSGVHKFQGEMDQGIELVEKGVKDESYIFMLEGKTVQVRLK